MLWRLLADLLVVLHLTAFTLVLAGPWLPEWLHAALLAAIPWGIISNRGRCRISQWEFVCRRRAYPDRTIRGKGLVRRLFIWGTRLDIGEAWATAFMVTALAASLAIRLYGG